MRKGGLSNHDNDALAKGSLSSKIKMKYTIDIISLLISA